MEDRQRHERLYKEVIEETGKNDKLFKTSEEFKNLQDSYLMKLDKFFRASCPNEFQWMDENASVEEGQFGPKDKNKEPEFHQKSEQLTNCIRKVDKDYTRPLEDFQDEFQNFQQSMQRKMVECTKKDNDSSIKECMKNVMLKGTDSMLGILSKYSSQLSEKMPQV